MHGNMIVVSCNYDVGSIDDLIELFMMGGYTIYFYHVDVYKRQVNDLISLLFSCSRFFSFVKYMRLDEEIPLKGHYYSQCRLENSRRQVRCV